MLVRDCVCYVFFFFFQAEDGIRDGRVTGVQTCALPICLRLDKRQNALRGGDYGPVIVPGKSAESKLIRRLVNGDGGLQMPPTGPLSEEEIGILRAWIDQGAEFRIAVEEDTAPKVVDPKMTMFISAVRSND